MPDEISIVGLEGAEEVFKNYKNNAKNIVKGDWDIPKFITALFCPEFSTSAKMTPLLDDRMFVVSWFGEDAIAGQLQQVHENKEDIPYYDYTQNDFWIKYTFVDYPNSTYQNSAKKRRIH